MTIQTPVKNVIKIIAKIAYRNQLNVLTVMTGNFSMIANVLITVELDILKMFNN